MKILKNTCIALMITLAACGGGEEKKDGPMTKEERIAEITKLEDSLFKSSYTLDKEAAETIIARYNEFAAEFPDDENAPDYLYKAADVATAINKPKIKVQNYKKLLEKYPDYKNNPNVLYLLAITLDSDMNQREEAKTYYEKVVAEGKDTNFIRDAKFRLESIDSLSYNAFMEMIINKNNPE